MTEKCDRKGKIIELLDSPRRIKKYQDNKRG